MAAKTVDGKHPAIFLDRDGVLNVDKGYVYKPSDLELIDGVPEALAELKRRGYLLLVISNQSGVARGKFGEAEVEAFNAALEAEVKRQGGVGVDAFYYCPHLPDGSVAAYKKDCDCRKPKPGMVLRAAREHDVDLSRSYFVGDKPDDVACALAAGIRGIQATATGYPRHPQALAHVPTLKDALSLLR